MSTVQTLKRQAVERYNYRGEFYYVPSLKAIEAASLRVRLTVDEDGRFSAYVDGIERFRTYTHGDGLQVYEHGAGDGFIAGPDRDNWRAGATPCESWHQIVGTCTRYSRGTFRGAVVELVAERHNYYG